MTVLECVVGRDSGQFTKEQCAAAAASCACFNFRKAARAVTQFFDETLQPCGLRSTQLVILLATYLYESASVAQLARELVVDRSTLTRNLKPLEKQNLVRVITGTDRRTRLVELTPEGEAALLKAVPLWEKAQTQFVSRLGETRWRDMLANLSAAVDLARRPAAR